MGATHNPDISITVALGPPPSPSAGYRLLIIVPLATNSLDGEDVIAYSSIEAATADEDSGFIAATTLARVTVALSQSPRPDIVYVGAVDLVGMESYSQALARLEGILGDNFFGVAIESRTAAIVQAVGAAVEAAGRRLFFFVSDASDWLSGTVPAALSQLAGADRSVAVYHDEAAEYPDVAFAARLLATDPQVLSARGPGALLTVAGLDTPITEAQRLALITLANVGLPYGTAPNWLSPAVSISGRPVSEIVSLEWTRRELRARIIATSIKLAPAKWTIDARGMALLESVLGSVAEDGINAQHFVTGQVRYQVFPPTTADRAAFRLRAEFFAQLASHAIRFTISGLLDRDPVVIIEG